MWRSPSSPDVQGQFSPFLRADRLRQSTFLVLDVAIASPAAKIPLMVGDIILELNGRSFTDLDALTAILEERQVGELLQIKWLRGDRQLSREIVLSASEATQEAA